MNQEKQRVHKRTCTIAAYGCICVALVAVILLGLWGAYRDVALVRSAALQAELAHLRTEAVHTVGRIERRIELTAQDSEAQLAPLLEQPWLAKHWKQVIPLENAQAYAAVVDEGGTVIMHSKPDRVGERLGRRWYEYVNQTTGSELFETRCLALTGGERAYNIRVPILIEGREIGEYHAGFDLDWFDQTVAQQRGEILLRWSWIVAAILLVVLLAAMSLYYIALHSIALAKAAELAEIQREAEMGQLASGLAHEVCNPLHAIRLNLHALGRAHNGSANLEPDDIAAITRESNHEIDRVDRLMRALVGFANPQKPQIERLELQAETRATLDFIHQELEQKRLQVETDFDTAPVLVNIDRSRFRQMLINLLGNAKDAAPEGGLLEVTVARQGPWALVSVADNGPGISQRDREQIFEPFYTTKDNGTGLGLALVKRFAEEAGGYVEQAANHPTGAKFSVLLPVSVTSPKLGKQKVVHS